MAQSAGQTITQRIALQGAEDIKRQLAEMGKEGEAAIKAIDRAVKTANSGRAAFAGGIANLHAKMTQMVGPLKPVGEAIGSVHERFTQLGQNVSNLANTVFPHFGEVLALVTAGAAAGALKLAESAAQNVRATENMAKTLGFSVKDYEALKLVAAQHGVSVEALNVSLGRFEQATGKAHEAQIKLTGAVQSGVTTLKGGAAAIAGVGSVLRGTTETVAEAHGKMAAAAESDVSVLRGGIKVVEDFSTPFKTMHENINDASGAFKSQIQLLTDFTAKAAAAKDGSVNYLAAQQAMGRGVKEALPMFQNFAADMDAARKKIEEAGIGIEGAEHRQAEAFNRAFDTMKLVASRLQEQVFNILGQALVPIMDAFTKAMTENGAAVRVWASGVTASVLPVVHDLINYFSGGAAPQTQFLKDLVPIFAQIAEGARLAFAIIKGGFEAMAFVLDPIAALINSIFGTHLTGMTLAATTAILGMVGAFTVLGSAIMAVVAVGGALVALWASWPALIAVAVVAMVATIYAFRDDIAAVFHALPEIAEFAWKAIQDEFQARIDQWKAIWKGFQDFVWNILSAIAAKASSAMAMVGIGGGSSGASPTGYAGGGTVQGPGGIDRVPILATAGEFVTRTHAVEVFGAPLLAAMNAYPERFLASLRGFAAGGLVGPPRPALAFAGGGLVTGGAGSRPGNNLTIVLDGQRFPASADDAVLGSLERSARKVQLVSTGRKPGYFGS